MGIQSQEAKQDEGKIQLTLVPPAIIWEIAKVRMYGCTKYPNGGRDNWKQVEPQRYRDALLRHIYKWLDGEDIDEESSLHHLSHAACNLAFLIELEVYNRWKF